MHVKKELIPLVAATVLLVGIGSAVLYLKRDTRLALRLNGQLLKVEIADTPEERARGLMYREELPEGTGMLFVYPDDDFRTFWMHNTPIPLSIAFIHSDGTIIQIEDMRPYDRHGVKSNAPVRYALEVPRGWFRRAGIAVGDKVEIPPELVGK